MDKKIEPDTLRSEDFTNRHDLEKRLDELYGKGEWFRHYTSMDGYFGYYPGQPSEPIQQSDLYPEIGFYNPIMPRGYIFLPKAVIDNSQLGIATLEKIEDEIAEELAKAEEACRNPIHTENGYLESLRGKRAALRIAMKIVEKYTDDAARASKEK